MIILSVIVGLLIIVTLASLIVVVHDSRQVTLPLYEVPKDGSNVFTLVDPTSVDLTLTICVEDTISHVSMMAQEWSGPKRTPGVLRVFTAAPGCQQYTFADIPIPSGQDPNAVPCVAWAMTGAIIPADRNRPSEPFSTAPSCIGGSPKLTPCDPGEC